jgi:lipopolysaccharide assembly outer membrane protein LptD (OstA)
VLFTSSNSFAKKDRFAGKYNFNREISLFPQDSTKNVVNPKDSIKKSKPMFTDIVKYEALDSIINNAEDNTVLLYGKAKIKYRSTELTAAFIKLSLKDETAEAKGIQDSTGKFIDTPIFQDGSQKFECKELKYNYRTDKAIVKEIITEDNGGFVQGKRTKKIDSNVYCVENGWYTTCDHHDHPHFYIKMTKAKMIKDDKIIAGPSYLVIEDVPLYFLGVPFGFFPVSKKGSSGIIIPTYGEEKMRGFNLKRGGYYLSINDYIDMTFLGDYYANGSWGLNVSSAYKKKYKYSGNFSLATSSNYSGEEGFPDYNTSKDYSFKWTHRQDPKANPYSTISASVDISTSKNDFYNYKNLNDVSNQRKQSSVSYSRRWPDSPFSMSMAFNHSQNSRDTTIAISFPNLNFRMTQVYPFRSKDKVGEMSWYDKIGVSYTADLKNSTPDKLKENKLFSTSFNKWKKGFQHKIPISASFKLLKDMTLSPSINYTGIVNFNSIIKRVDGYSVSDTGDNIPNVIVDTLNGLSYAHNYSASISLAYSPKIFGMYTFNKTSKVEAIRHVMTPNISFSYTPKIGIANDKYMRTYSYLTNDNEIAYQEYYKYERVGIFSVPKTPEKESGSIGLSLDNNLEMKLRTVNDSTNKAESKKVKILESFRLSTRYDMFRDSMKFDQIQLSARTSLFNKKISINLTGNLDPYALDASGRRINQFHGGLGRLTRAAITTGMNFSSDKGDKNKNAKEAFVGNYADYVDFDVPWTINIDYSYTYQKLGLAESTNTQIFRVNGDFSLTPKWKLGFNTGYDVDRKEITASSFNIYRDLHCWEMTFNCVPFGTHQSFNFEIKIKSSLLQDLKLTKRDSWYDR